MGLLEDHVAWCARRGLRPTYIESLGYTLNRLQSAVGPLELAPEQAIEGWWNSLQVGDGTRVTYGAHVSGFYRWLVRQRLRADDPTARLDRPRLRKGLPRPMPDDRLARAIARAPEPIRTWLLLAAFMGLRACEVATLHRDDIRDDLGVIIVREGKGGKQRIVPFHPAVTAALEQWPIRGFLFTRPRGGHVLPNTVSVRANRYLHRCGISETFHQARHWYATKIYAESLDLRMTQELMGHSSPDTTARYAGWTPGRAAGVVERLRLPEPDNEIDELPDEDVA